MLGYFREGAKYNTNSQSYPGGEHWAGGEGQKSSLMQPC